MIPGLVAIDPGLWDGQGPAEIVRGPLAGKAHLPELSDWKRELWLVPRAVAERHRVPIPGEGRDLSATPRLRALLAEAALVVVDEARAGRLLAAGERALSLSYHRVSGGGSLALFDRGAERGFSAEDPALWRQITPRDDDGELDLRAPERVYDPILRALTGGALSLRDVDFADFAAHLRPADFAAREDDLRELEDLADRRRPDAERLLAALDAAEGPRVDLPGGYHARRERRPGFVLAGGGDVVVSGAPIEVPAEERWVVDDVAALRLPGRDARRDAALAAARAAHAQRRSLRPVVLGLFAAAGLAACLRACL